MLRRGKPNGSRKQKIAFDRSTIASPPKLFLAPPSSPISSSPEPAETSMSPTSILQAMPLSPTICGGGGGSSSVSTTITTTAAAHFRYNNGSDYESKNQHHHPWDARLGLVDALNDDTVAGKKGSDHVKVLTGSKLRIQTKESCSPSKEFGVKNRASGTPMFADMVHPSPSRCLSPREMELSEDYTCVIARGPNPRTTHIFDNCVVESCGFSTGWMGKGEDDFLRYCHGCSKDLGQGKDIFMYRGEKAFCSRECRYREMLFDEGMGMEECLRKLAGFKFL